MRSRLFDSHRRFRGPLFRDADRFLALRTTLQCFLTLNFVSTSTNFSARIVPCAYPQHRPALRPQAVEEATATARVQADLRIAALQAQILELQAGG